MLLLLDLFPNRFTRAYKIQKDRPLHTSRLPSLFSTLLKVQMLVFLPCNIGLSALSLHTSWGLKMDPSLPSPRTLFLHTLGYGLVDEILFYFMHRLAHHRQLYR